MTTPDDNAYSDPVLRRLPVALVDILGLSNAERVTVNQGRSMIPDGQDFNAVFLISEGWAVSKLAINTGDTQILNILGPGSFAGISRIDDASLSDYSAVALEDIWAYKIDLYALQSICSKDETLSRWLSDLLVRRIQRTQRHLTALGQLPARGRLAFMMLRILDVAQQTGHSAIGETIRLPMTQEEIGNMLGLTNVSISKMMSALRKDGLIDYGRNRIVIHNVKALSELCGMEMADIPATAPFAKYEVLKAPAVSLRQ
ncbi:MAG: Crp/Fnr family transcriptional regulator [Litorimonas sp.]